MQILIEFGHHRNDRLPAISAILAKSFGFQFESYLDDYRRQSTVVELLVDKLKDKIDPVDAGIFLQVAKEYLRSEHMSGHMEDGSRYVWREFVLQPRPSLVQLRSTIWLQLLNLIDTPEFGSPALSLLREYTIQNNRSRSSQIVEHDAQALLPLVQNRLTPAIYAHCQVVQDYLDLMDDMHIPFDSALRIQFQHPALDIFAALSMDWSRRAGISLEEYERQTKERLITLLTKLDRLHRPAFFDHCREILAVEGADQPSQIRQRVAQLLWLLAEERPSDFPQILLTILVREINWT